MAKRYSDEDKKHAMALYAKHGLEITCEVTGIARGTINKWRKDTGTPAPSVSNKKGAPKTNYTKAERLRLNNLLMERAEHILVREGDNLKMRELKDLALTYAILTDKRRVEEGIGEGEGMNIEEMEQLVKRTVGNVRELKPGAKRKHSA